MEEANRREGTEALSFVELVERAREDTPIARVAEEEVCRRFAPRIRLYGLRHLRDQDQAAELVQVVLMATIEAIRAGRVEDPEHLDRFVLGTCRNTAHRMRDTNARATPHPPHEMTELGPIVEPFADARAHAVDLDALFRCIAALDERSRAVVQLTYQEERSPDDIAAAFATTIANVRVIRHRAIAQLRGCMDGGGRP